MLSVLLCSDYRLSPALPLAFKVRSKKEKGRSKKKEKLRRFFRALQNSYENSDQLSALLTDRLKPFQCD
jgi:hypothetical protein